MIGFLLQLDNQLFIFISRLPHNFITDSFFAFFSGIGTGGIVWFLVITALFIREEIKDKVGFYALILAIITSFIIVENGFKNIIARPRPQSSILQMETIGDIGNSFSFPSGHATLAFAAAYILAVHHKKWARWYYFLASLIAFSRIYLGRHYPSDVIIGAILGVLIGLCSIKLVSKLTMKPTKIQL